MSTKCAKTAERLQGMSVAKRDKRELREEALRALARGLHLELGLTPGAMQVAQCDGVLTVRLTHALTPMTRMIADRDAGAEIVQRAFEALLDDCRTELTHLAARVAGLPVHHIRLQVDMPAERVVIEFFLQREGNAHA